jgi:hypothetical protein
MSVTTFLYLHLAMTVNLDINEKPYLLLNYLTSKFSLEHFIAHRIITVHFVVILFSLQFM